MDQHIIIFMVPITAIIATFIFLSITVRAKFQQQQHERELINRERLMAMEKGINMPVIEPPSNRQHKNPLVTGLLCLGVGIGLGIFLYALTGASAGIWGVGVLVGCIGVANLVYWQVAGKKDWQAQRNTDQAIADAYVNYLNGLAQSAHRRPENNGQ